MRIGVVGGVPFVERLTHRHDVVRVGDDVGAVRVAAVDAWLISAGLVLDEVVEAVLAHEAPVLFLATGADVEVRVRLLEPGRVDVARMPASEVEAEARLKVLVQGATSWSLTASRLCTTAAHDLRSPLQGLRFTLSALAREGLFAGEWAEDLEMLEAVADTMEVQLHGMYNLGRALGSQVDEVVDLAGMLTEDAGRAFFADRLDVALPGPLWVRGNSGDLRYALLDVLRVMSQLAPGGKRVRVQGLSTAGNVRVEVSADVMPAVLERHEALLSRAEPVLARGKLRLPFAGLAFANEAVQASGGRLALSAAAADRLVVTITFPAPRVGPGTSLG
jgi:DNA-binding response OmpR family regulator